MYHELKSSMGIRRNTEKLSKENKRERTYEKRDGRAKIEKLRNKYVSV
jgi:hypothetical protein